MKLRPASRGLVQRLLELRGQWFDADDCAGVLIPQPEARERSGFLHLHVANVGFMRQ